MVWEGNERENGVHGEAIQMQERLQTSITVLCSGTSKY